ncbi:MAG: bifunctional diaminohydroxyphosphoribosylaminopyrimidine deaminase/5-amino-6-(5-phosphoribosylamino)uracil reductase RibD [Bacteroidales bacterium]
MNITSEDNLFMSRCIELARCAMNTARPNPMVGAVIMREGKIIGEGFHRKYGEPHAEVNAIASVKDKELLKDATIYVSLEPCSHYGKTPPCSELIIRMGIPRVVIGTADPFPKVSGRGINQLRAAGVQVKVGVMEKECNELNKFFFHYQKYHKPYVILKWAQSADGFIDKHRSSTNTHACKISNTITQVEVHKLRAQVQAILVGTETAVKDNPSLTVRSWHGNHPVRIVLDRTGRLDTALTLFDNRVKTFVVTENASLLRERFAGKENIEIMDLPFDAQWQANLLTKLGKKGIQSILIEGGAHTLQSFIDCGEWDEANIETSDILISEGVSAPVLKQMIWKETNQFIHNKIDSFLRNKQEE